MMPNAGLAQSRNSARTHPQCYTESLSEDPELSPSSAQHLIKLGSDCVNKIVR